MTSPNAIRTITYRDYKTSARPIASKTNEKDLCERVMTYDGVFIKCARKENEGILSKIGNLFKKVVDFWSK